MRCPNCKSRSVIRHGDVAKADQVRCQTCQTFFSAKSRKMKNVIWGVVGGLAVLGLSPWWLNKGLQATVAQSDRTASADAIVVLGRGPDYTEHRTAAAIKLWRDGKAPHIFISGILDAPVMIEMATDRGIPGDSVSGESCSRSTWENAFYSEMLLTSDQLSSIARPKILLITDDLHIARATLIFRSFGFEVIPYPVKNDFSMWRQHILREFFVLMYYVKSGKLQPPTTEDYEFANTQAKSRIAKRQCILASQ